MKAPHRTSLPLFSTRLTATVSVALVLLVLGAAGLFGIGAANIANDIRSTMGFVVVMDENASPADVVAIKQRLLRERFVSSTSFSSADDVMARWQQTVGDDENLKELLGDVNPFSPEFEVHVKPLWADNDSLAMLASRFEMLPGVGEVKVHSEMIRNVNAAIRTVVLISAGVAAVLLLISLVLINNTVRLTIYSRRFTIHTMKLVGATGAFIRRPIVRANTLAGLLAACISAGILASLLAWARSLDSMVAATISFSDAVWVFVGMMLAGVIICWLTSTFATNKYLRAGHDDLFK